MKYLPTVTHTFTRMVCENGIKLELDSIDEEVLDKIAELIEDTDVTIVETTADHVTLSNGSKIVTQPNACLLGLYPATEYMAEDSINIGDMFDLYIYVTDWF